MSQRHWVQNNDTMMVTTVTKSRKPIFNNPSYARMAVEQFYKVQNLHPFYLFAFVVMHDHIHALIRAIAPSKISNIIGTYKSGLVFEIGLLGGSAPRNGCGWGQKKTAGLWQKRFHAKIVDDANEAIEYIHHNPVEAGYVERAQDYPWSSASGMWDVSPLEEWHHF